MTAPRLDVAALRASPRPRVLMVMHEAGGGVERHVRDLGRLLADRAEVLWLRPWGGKLALTRGAEAGGLYLPPAAWETLVALLQAIGIHRIHLHHVDGLPPQVLELPRRLGVPYDVTLHDFYPICPEYHCMGGDGRYCGGAPTCRRCDETRPPAWPMSLDQWRGGFWGFLERAARVIAPSQDAAMRVRRHFPAVTYQVWPHPELADASVPAVRVLVAGALSPIKGLGLLEACVRDAAARALPLHFRLVGFMAQPIPHWPELPFSLTGEFPEGTLPQMLAAENAQVAFFPAQCPETFSYTLTDVLATGLPVVATDLGALPERLAARGDMRIVRADASAASINDALLAVARPAPSGAPRGEGAGAYGERYAAPLPASVQPPQAEPPVIDPSWRVEPGRTLPQATLSWLYTDGILCGKAGSRERLRVQAAEADALVPQLRDALSAAQSESRALEARLRRIEGSNSWRLTGPIRALARRLRGR